MIPGLPPLKVIETQTLGSSAASVTLPASGTIADLMPSGSRHVVVLINGITTSGQQNLNVRFNGDSGNNYNTQGLDGAGSSASAFRQDAQAQTIITVMGADSNEFGGGMLLIPHAFGTSNHKATLGFGGNVENIVRTTAGRWANTAAITSVTILLGGNSLDAGTVIKLCVVDEDYLYHATDGEVILGSDGTFTFDSLPDAAGDISVIGYMRSDRSATDDNVLVELNADTTATNYHMQRLLGLGSSEVS